MAKLGYQNFETPEPINTKCGMHDYVGDITPQAKIQSNRPVGASRHRLVKYYSRAVLNFLNPIFAHSRGQAVEPIFTLFASLHVNPSLLHSWRDQTAKKFPLPLLLPRKLPQKGCE